MALSDILHCTIYPQNFNETGLSASIYSRDETEAFKMARWVLGFLPLQMNLISTTILRIPLYIRRIESGAVHINGWVRYEGADHILPKFAFWTGSISHFSGLLSMTILSFLMEVKRLQVGEVSMASGVCTSSQTWRSWPSQMDIKSPTESCRRNNDDSLFSTFESMNKWSCWWNKLKDVVLDSGVFLKYKGERVVLHLKIDLDGRTILREVN